jgi:predicted thioesterase
MYWIIPKAIRHCCLTIVLVSVALGSTLHAQQTVPPVAEKKVDLSLIVTDKEKKTIKSISKDEVRVFEDKLEQTLYREATTRIKRT